jgi:hypothetical protein
VAAATVGTKAKKATVSSSEAAAASAAAGDAGAAYVARLATERDVRMRAAAEEAVRGWRGGHAALLGALAADVGERAKALEGVRV